MILKTSNKHFAIYQKLRSYKELNLYLAKEGDSNANHYLITEILCPQIIRSCIKELLALREEKSFSQFVDVFSFNSKLYLVLEYTKPMLLLDYLSKNKLTFGEKVKTLDNYLFQLASYASLPMSIRIALTDLENINLQPDHSVFFNFLLTPQSIGQSHDKASLLKGISAVIKAIFVQELSSTKGKELQLIIEKCEKSIYKTVPEIIKDVKNIDTSSTWDKLKLYLQEKKSSVQRVKDLGMTVFLVLLVVVVYSRFISPNPLGSQLVPVTQIGEVVIIEESLEEEPEQESPAPPPVVIKVE